MPFRQAIHTIGLHNYDNYVNLNRKSMTIGKLVQHFGCFELVWWLSPKQNTPIVSNLIMIVIRPLFWWASVGDSVWASSTSNHEANDANWHAHALSYSFRVNPICIASRPTIETVPTKVTTKRFNKACAPHKIDTLKPCQIETPIWPQWY